MVLKEELFKKIKNMIHKQVFAVEFLAKKRQDQFLGTWVLQKVLNFFFVCGLFHKLRSLSYKTHNFKYNSILIFSKRSTIWEYFGKCFKKSSFMHEILSYSSSISSIYSKNDNISPFFQQLMTLIWTNIQIIASNSWFSTALTAFLFNCSDFFCLGLYN